MALQYSRRRPPAGSESPVAYHRVCGYRDDGDTAQRRVCLQTPHYLQAVDTGQSDIAKDRVRNLAASDLKASLTGVRGIW